MVHELVKRDAPKQPMVTKLPQTKLQLQPGRFAFKVSQPAEKKQSFFAKLLGKKE